MIRIAKYVTVNNLTVKDKTMIQEVMNLGDWYFGLQFILIGKKIVF